MSINNPMAYRYREVAIKTANPIQLVVILYDGAIQALQEAREYLKQKDIAGRGRSINRSVAIISELQASLNFSAGGEIAPSLDRLYNYMKQRIFNANVEQSPGPLAEVIVLLGNLRSAWVELASGAASKEAPARTSQPSAPMFTAPNESNAPAGSFNISG